MLDASRLAPYDYRIHAMLEVLYNYLNKRDALNSDIGKELRVYHE